MRDNGNTSDKERKEIHENSAEHNRGSRDDNDRIGGKHPDVPKDNFYPAQKFA
jgi:hypothetical protein